MKKSSPNKVYAAYDWIIAWLDQHRNKELVMEKQYLEYIEVHIPLEGAGLSWRTYS